MSAQYARHAAKGLASKRILRRRRIRQGGYRTTTGGWFNTTTPGIPAADELNYTVYFSDSALHKFAATSRVFSLSLIVKRNISSVVVLSLKT